MHSDSQPPLLWGKTSGSLKLHNIWITGEAWASSKSWYSEDTPTIRKLELYLEAATGYVHENTNSLFWLKILGYSALLTLRDSGYELHAMHYIVPCMFILQKQQEYQTKSTVLCQVIWASSSLGCLTHITAVCFSLRVVAQQMRESRSLFTVQRPGSF